jgi:hypothetical protein
VAGSSRLFRVGPLPLGFRAELVQNSGVVVLNRRRPKCEPDRDHVIRHPATLGSRIDSGSLLGWRLKFFVGEATSGEPENV